MTGKMAKGKHINGYGRRGLPVDWNAIKTLWCAGKLTSGEVAAMFPPCTARAVESRASREGWRELRDQARDFLRAAGQKLKSDSRGPETGGPVLPAQTPFVLPIPLPERNYSKRTVPHDDPERRVPESRVNEKTGRRYVPATTLPDSEILRRAIEIQNADGFRARVLQANEKALSVLEKHEPTNVGEVDRFAEALTKVERIGARTYGYDRESDRPVVNIGILTAGAGSEYD